MNDKTLSLLGLVRRANRLVYGFDMTVKSIKEKQTKLVLITSDISTHTESDIKKVCEDENIKLIKTNYQKTDIESAISKYVAVIGITDEGFKNKLGSLLETDSKKEEM